MSPSLSNLSGCVEARQLQALGRRGFLRLGALGATGLGLSQLLQAQVQADTQSTHRAKSVIILWMRGGPSHIDMWDPKPDAPPEYRGEFGTMSTSVPGIQLTDMLPMTAGIMDQWSIVRSLTHDDAGHSSGDQICFTGHKAGLSPDENIHPSCGSIVAEKLGKQNPRLPAYVMVPRQVPGTGAAYLGAANQPFETQSDPASPGPFRVPNFAMPEGLSVDRLGDRRAMLSSFDRLRREADAKGQVQALDRFQSQAWSMISSPEARQAFDLDAESPATRERYGLMPAFDPGASNRCGAPAWSQRILLARRLVEAGVRLVTVDLRWWDTHVKGFESLRLGFLPRWDRAYTALIGDLRERGLLNDVMVVAWGEFGRTPRVNNDAGRDHYPNVFSAALAGGGIRGGRVVGESDSHGAFPKSNPKSPQDVLATIYRHLGIDTGQNYINNAGRPIPILPSGTAITELFS